MRYEDVVDISDIKFIHITASEFTNEARNHATGDWATGQGGHVYKVITTAQGLLEFFVELRGRGANLRGVDFHTHGIFVAGETPIGISFDEGDQFNYINIESFSGNEFDSVFMPGANIMFYGCEVSGNYTGEYFLTRVGSIFLSSGGGTVKGYRVLGFGRPQNAWLGLQEVPDDHEDAAPRDQRSLVTAVVRPNGWTQRIRNATWLTPSITGARVNRIRDAILCSVSSSQGYACERAYFNEYLQFLNCAITRLAGAPSYRIMFEIHKYIDDRGGERNIIEIDRVSMRRPSYRSTCAAYASCI